MNLVALIALQALTILTTAAFIRALGRRRRTPPLVAPTTPQTTTSTTPTHRAVGPLQQLLGRARKGMALAGLLLGFAFLPWPTAWALSATLAPDLSTLQAWIVRNMDIVTIAAVIAALAEPLIVRVFKWLRQIPRMVWLLVRLARVQVQIGYWRIRNWHARRTGQEFGPA
jgi:hypothetical protein